MAVKKYLIHDNGGRPFLVLIEKSINGQRRWIKVFKKSNVDVDDPDFMNSYYDEEYVYGCHWQNNFKQWDDLLLTIPQYEKIWIGYDTSGYLFDGNSLLVKINTTTYLYIGSEIYSFTSTSPIIQYFSPVGNNDVPYPFALTGNGKIILVLEHAIIKEPANFWLNLDQDFLFPYTKYYEDESKSQPLDYSLLVARL